MNFNQRDIDYTHFNSHQCCVALMCDIDIVMRGFNHPILQADHRMYGAWFCCYFVGPLMRKIHRLGQRLLDGNSEVLQRNEQYLRNSAFISAATRSHSVPRLQYLCKFFAIG